MIFSIQIAKGKLSTETYSTNNYTWIYYMKRDRVFVKLFHMDMYN